MPLRVLHLIPSFGAGGAQKQLGLLAEAQVAGGLEVHIAYRDEGPNVQYAVRSGANLVRLKLRGNQNVLAIVEIAMLVWMVRPDIVQTWMHSMDVMGGIACLALRIPWICSERSGEGWYDMRVLRNRLRCWVGARSSIIVANSQSGMRFWLSLGVSAQKLRVVPNIVVIPASVPNNRVGKFRVATIGRLIESKCVDLLIRAFVTVRQVESTAKLIVIGDGPEGERLGSLAAELGLAEAVEFAGALRDVTGVLQACDLFVSLSRSEGTPNSVLEAAASRVPMILSDIDAHRDLFGNEDCIFVEPGNINDVADAIVHAFNAPDLTARAWRAYQRVVPLRASAIHQAYVNLYGECL